MTASTFDALRPRRPAGMGRGAMLALLVHAGLVVALAFGVSWRSSEPTGATAELWAAVPEVAAPAAVAPPEPKPAPPPPPKVEAPAPPRPDLREAEIALEKAKVEKARREREEREKQEALKKQREEQAKAERAKAEAAARAEKAEAERLARLRDEQLKRIQGQAGATGGPNATGSAARDAGPSASYAGRIVARVKPNIVLTESVPSTLRAEVEVRAAPDGTILGRRLVRSSGNKDWDDAVLRAIDRTEVLPRDVDGRVPSPMVLVFTPV